MSRTLALSVAQEKSEMDACGGKPEKKNSRREMKSKSLSLPPGAMLMAHPTGDGFFSKIRKCLRLKSKGKYDFSSSAASASESAGGSPVSQHSRSSGSPVLRKTGSPSKGCDSAQLRPKSSPIKMSRKSKSDKEEVILIRNDKRSSGGVKLASKRTLEGCRDEILVVTVQDNQHKIHVGEEACAAADSQEQDLRSGIPEEDLDPDYETLDEVRRKVRSTITDCDLFPGTDTEKNVVDEEIKKMLMRQPMQIKVKCNGDLNGKNIDFDVDSPFTDSSISNKENLPVSPASSMMSTSLVSTIHPHCIPNLIVVNGAISLASPPSLLNDSMTMSSMTASCTSQVLEEDDLYSNAKVISRKKSKKCPEASIFFDTEQRSSFFMDQPQSSRNSLSPADLLVLMEMDNPASAAPPPLPVRNYSAEEDLDILRMRRDGQRRHSALVGGQSSAEADSEQMVLRSDRTCSTAGARPKTCSGSTSGSRNSAVVEEGPVLTVNLSTVAAPGTMSTHVSQLHESPVTVSPNSNIYEDLPVDNFYEDIPARMVAAGADQVTACAPSRLCTEVDENDLAFIDDEDLSPGLGSQLSSPSSPVVVNSNPNEKVTVGVVPDDVMIVSASDSMLGNETDDGQSSSCFNTPSVQSEEPCEQETVLKDMSPSEFAGSELSENLCSGQSLSGCIKEGEVKTECVTTEDARLAEQVSGLLHFPRPASPTSPASSSSSSPHLSSVSSLSAVSSPSPSSPSTDTLNNATENDTEDATFDPDDWEGKDRDPPTGPPIHISHRQLQQRLEAKEDQPAAASMDLEPPPVPERRPFRRTGREARSMDLSSLVLRDRGDASGSRAQQRHSTCSLSPAAQAHKDFLESMKQLKECGWYWGPVSYEEAESKLMDKRDGSFLVRDSSNENYILSLSFKSMGHVHHTRIEHHKGLFSFWSQPDSHGKAQICQFIEQTVQNSRNGRFLYFLRPSGPGSPPLPIQLLYPVSRFCRVPSLQHMCRFLVLRCVRRDHIECLPIPEKVKGYLKEKQYYVETLEED